jgi:hypothetical protein
MCLTIRAKDESFGNEATNNYMERRPQTTIRRGFLFPGRASQPVAHGEEYPIDKSKAKSVFKRPDSLTLAKYAPIRKNKADEVKTGGGAWAGRESETTSNLMA